MDRQARKLTSGGKEGENGSENGSELGSNTDSESEEKVSYYSQTVYYKFFFTIDSNRQLMHALFDALVFNPNASEPIYSPRLFTAGFRRSVGSDALRLRR